MRPREGLRREFRVCATLLMLSVLGLGSSVPAQAQATTDVPSGNAAQAIKTLQKSADSRTPAQQKVDSSLLEALGLTAVSTHSTATAAQKHDALVDIELDVAASASDANALAGYLATQGASNVQAYPEFHAIHALVPLKSVQAIAAQPHVKFIRLSRPPLQHVGGGGPRAAGIDIEGITAHRVDALHTLGFDGRGVRVGIISDSIDNSNGDLASAQTTVINGKTAIDPKLLTVVKDAQGRLQSGYPAHLPYGASAEGLAMAEIVHAVAPRAELYFATDADGEYHMAGNIRLLAGAPYNCRIIVDDTTYSTESPFQDGPIATAITDVTEKGVLYVSSAANGGNFAQQSAGTWESDFLDSGRKWPGGDNQLELFGRDRAYETFVDTANLHVVNLYWSDPLQSSQNEYQIYVTDAAGNILGYANDKTTGGRPFQSVTLPVGLPPDTRIYVVKVGDSADRYLHLEAPGAVFVKDGQTTGAVRGHNASQSVITVGAVPAPEPPGAYGGKQRPSVAVYSADGPRRIFYRPDGSPITPGNYSSSGGLVLNKPDVFAAAGLTTSVAGFEKYTGTSASAPQAAGMLALLLQAQPALSSTQARFALHVSALQSDTHAGSATGGFGVTMGPALLGLAGPTGLFVTNSEADTVTKVSDGELFSGNGLKRPRSLAIFKGKLYVANWGDKGISVFDLNDPAKPQRPIEHKGMFNRDANMAAADDKLFVLDGAASGGVYVFDLAHDGAFLEKLVFPRKYNGALAYANGLLFLSFDRDGEVGPCNTCSKVDGIGIFSAADHFHKGINLGDSRLRRPIGMAVQGTRLYIANSGNDTVSVFDLTTHHYLATIKDTTLSGIRDLAVQSGKLFVANGADDSISVFDTTQSNTFVTKLGAFTAPGGLALQP